MNTLTISIIILIIYLFTIHLNSKYKSTPKIYMNLDMRDICKKTDENLSNKENQLNKPLPKETEKSDTADAKDLYPNISSFPICGDDKLTYRMYDMGQKNKHSMTNRAMWNKNNLIPYLEEELRTHSNSLWWDDETLENEF